MIRMLQFWKSRQICSSLMGVVWFTTHLFLAGPPQFPGIEGSDWLLLTAVIFIILPVPMHLTARHGILTWVSLIGLYTAILSPLLSLHSVPIAMVIILLHSLLSLTSIFLFQKQPGPSPVLAWILCAITSAVLIADTGSIVYAQQQASLIIPLGFSWFYQQRNKSVTQQLTLPFFILFSTQIILSYHFSFLPFYSAVLLIVAPCSWLFFSVIWHRYLLLLVLLFSAVICSRANIFGHIV